MECCGLNSLGIILAASITTSSETTCLRAGVRAYSREHYHVHHHLHAFHQGNLKEKKSLSKMAFRTAPDDLQHQLKQVAHKVIRVKVQGQQEALGLQTKILEPSNQH